MVKVIDVSHHQEEIDWEKVKADGISGAIIRVADSTGTMDRQCDRNISECERLGIPFGLYIYSRATTRERVQEEARICLDKAKGHVLSYPIYIDLEQEGTEDYAVTAAEIFSDIMEEAGYWCGVYANQYWWSTYLTGLTCFTKWVARYGEKPTIENYDMWQYTSTARVEGISGNVDMNDCYRDFPEEMNGIVVIPERGEDVVVLDIDGIWGTATTKRLQQIFGTPQDGIVSHQYAAYKDDNPGLRIGWQWEEKPSGNSLLIQAIQKWVGAAQDGYIGPKTIRAMQEALGTVQDGYVSNPSLMVKALQRWANDQAVAELLYEWE